MKLPPKIVNDVRNGREFAVLHLKEDGEFYVEWQGEQTEKNVLHGKWSEKIIYGQFALVPIPQTFKVDTSEFTGSM